LRFQPLCLQWLQPELQVAVVVCPHLGVSHFRDRATEVLQTRDWAAHLAVALRYVFARARQHDGALNLFQRNLLGP
jgi:hypothetical protein